MALKVVHVSDVPHLDQVPENAALALCSTRFSTAAQFPVDFIEFDIQVFSLTNGGCEIYTDIRRNSLDEAIKLCLASGLHGIVSEVKATFRSPEAVARIEESKLSLITYGQLN
ncbi:hypothetical protein QUC31_014530 [Theobroma cacao]